MSTTLAKPFYCTFFFFIEFFSRKCQKIIQLFIECRDTTPRSSWNNVENKFAWLRPPRQTFNDIPGEKWIENIPEIKSSEKTWKSTKAVSKNWIFLHRCRSCAACSINSCRADNHRTTSHNADYTQRREWTHRWDQTSRYDIGDNQWAQLSTAVKWVAGLRYRGSDTRLENARQTTHRHTRKEVNIRGCNQGTHEGTWLVGG